MIQQGQEEPASSPTVNIDGADVPFTEGETLYEICSRQQKDVPTLCYDARLDPFGGCRLCVVELEGARNPVASCTTRATAGMKVRTKTEAIERHRRTLLELVVSENRQMEVDELAGYASQELKTLVEKYDANPDASRAGNPDRAATTTTTPSSCATTTSASPATDASGSALNRRATTRSV